MEILTKNINSWLDQIDDAMNYIWVQILKLETIKIFSKTLTPKLQAKIIVVWIICIIWVLGSNVFAGEWHWHGDEEAEQLWNNVPVLSWEIFISPKEVQTDSISNQSYPWIIMSDEYGSIFSSRDGIVTKLNVNLWDTVKKWQTVATVWTNINSPEIIWLIASKRSDIAVSQWQLNAAINVTEYLKSNVWSGNNIMQNVYDTKRKAIDIWIETQKEWISIKIANLESQIGAKKQLIDAKKISNVWVIWINEERQKSIEKLIQWSIQNAISKMWKVFGKSETSPELFEKEIRSNAYIWARDSKKKSQYQALMTQLLYQYQKRDILSINEKFALADLTEKALKEWVSLLSSSITNWEYTEDKLNNDMNLLIDAYSNADIWILVIIWKYKEIQKEWIWSNAIASWNIIEANAELIWIDQEIILLNKELSLLESQKNQEIAWLEWEQSTRWFDIQKLIIESEWNIIKAKAELQANQNALWAVQWITKSINVVAPFAWTISRKNITIWQSVSTSNPIFDIIWLNSDSDSFVRFEVPVSEFSKLKIWNDIKINLWGDDESFGWLIKRIAKSVNQNTQTVTVEGEFSDSKSPYPLWTNIRISSQWLSWETTVEIPNTAIEKNDLWESYIYKKLPNDTIKKRIIEIWYTEWEKSYINKWLKSSDVIVADISKWNLKEWMKITDIH